MLLQRKKHTTCHTFGSISAPFQIEMRKDHKRRKKACVCILFICTIRKNSENSIRIETAEKEVFTLSYVMRLIFTLNIYDTTRSLYLM